MPHIYVQMILFLNRVDIAQVILLTLKVEHLILFLTQITGFHLQINIMKFWKGDQVFPLF